jgi:hypothetical protein
MDAIKYKKLFEYFDVPPELRSDVNIVKKVEYIHNTLEGLDEDQIFQVLKKYDVIGTSQDRLGAIWRHFKFGELTKEFISEVKTGSPYSLYNVVETMVKPQETQAELPEGVTKWSL